MTWTPDTIQGSVLDLEQTTGKAVRTGVMSRITETTDPRELLAQVVAGLVANGITLNPPSAYSTSYPTLLLRRIRVEGIGPTEARAYLQYETPEFGGPATAYILSHSSTLTARETDLLPGTRIPIRIPDTTVAALAGTVIKGDNVLMRFLTPVEMIRVNALTYSAPRAGRVGGVNNATWPVGQSGFTSYPTGYWLISQWETTQSKYQGYYTLDAAAMTRVDEDWSETGILIDRTTGKRIPIPSGAETAASAPAYSRGIIYNTDGIIRVGPYPLISFPIYFGF